MLRFEQKGLDRGAGKGIISGIWLYFIQHLSLGSKCSNAQIVDSWLPIASIIPPRSLENLHLATPTYCVAFLAKKEVHVVHILCIVNVTE